MKKFKKDFLRFWNSTTFCVLSVDFSHNSIRNLFPGSRASEFTVSVPIYGRPTASALNQIMLGAMEQPGGLEIRGGGEGALGCAASQVENAVFESGNYGVLKTFSLSKKSGPEIFPANGKV